MPTITLDVTDTPHGVTIRASGPLHGETDAAWVARSMVEFAAPIFAGGKPVQLGSEAAPITLDSEGLITGNKPPQVGLD